MPPIYQPGQHIDHYTIVSLLGQGGASDVYRAHDQQSQQDVVLKFPHIDEIGSADVFACYQREAAIGKRLSHPLIQRHLNQEEERSAEYLVLEYLHGQTLREAMKRCAPERIPREKALRIVVQVAQALQYAHEQGVIHCDVKPENIFLQENDNVVLCDFGIARWVSGRSLFRFGFTSPLGTPAYMAPELLWGKRGSVRSDIYAVGVVLYELLCGRTPFEEHNTFEFLSQHISHDPPSILIWNLALSPGLATVVMRAIRRDPRKRYASMHGLLDDLEHLEDATPIDYLPDPPLAGGRYRQAWRIALLILAILLCIVAFGFLAQFAHPAVR
jgi:eukaryotic-like serine/threonine-protein kinase